MRDRNFDFSRAGRQTPSQPKKHDPLQDALRFAQGIVPGIGAVGGGLAGGLAGALVPGLQPFTPALIGGGMAAGSAGAKGIGDAIGYGADVLGRDQQEAEEERLAKDQERFARESAALQLLGGL